jgi:purine-binding chemotaxis protein CheW
VLVIAMVGKKTVGLLVDAISDVLHVSADGMRPAPNFGTAVDTQFLDGVFQTREHLAVALNLERLLTESELSIPETVNSLMRNPKRRTKRTRTYRLECTAQLSA